jgi:hypothetical protein
MIMEHLTVALLHEGYAHKSSAQIVFNKLDLDSITLHVNSMN